MSLVQACRLLRGRMDEWEEGNGRVSVTPSFASRIARLCTTLSLQSGHALLLGTSGAGKTTAALLAARLCGLRVTPLTACSDSSVMDTALRSAMLAAGVEGVPTVLLCDGEVGGGGGAHGGRSP